MPNRQESEVVMSATITRTERDLWVAAGRAVAVAEYDGRVNDADPDDETVHLSDTAFDDYLSDEPIPDCFG